MSTKQQVTGPTGTELPTPGDAPTVDAVSSLTHSHVAEAQLSVALTWARRGFPVVPCSRTDKGAMVPGFGKSVDPDEIRKFADPEQVSRWWKSGRFARAHVGLLTGRGGTDGRGLVVIDLDMPKPDAAPLSGQWAECAGGTDVLELLMRAASAEWPDTYTVLTPSGGMHLYFQQPADGPLIGCATGDAPTAPALGPLIDIRGIGGYVIAAGSYSAAQGRPYTRVSTPDLLPQPLPGWLLELLRPTETAAPRRQDRPTRVHAMPTGDRAERAAAAALAKTADRIGALSAGDGRNAKLFGAARWLGEISASAPHILTEAAVTAELAAAAEQCGLKGGQRAALATIANGWKAGVRDAMGGAA
ncbi:bifunctional DNA primase/polymerase [Streptomyces sp. NPDC058228]|uniref:bifunctional DNA primase/polymerase n=1 Tax=Streptomyces sp. NPDC058228 TaxID=3346390 RepID=UPI0036E656B1